MALDLPADTVVLPHPREVPEVSTILPGDRHIGFLGTPRGHKGTEVIVSVVRSDRDRRLHVFAGTDRWWTPVAQQVIEHAPDEPLDSIYRGLSLVLLPQDSSPGGKFQLPAKLLDAMRYGVPVIATNTPAIAEVLGHAGILIDDWKDAPVLNEALERCRIEGRALGETARRRVLQEFAPAVLGPRLRSLLDTA